MADENERKPKGLSGLAADGCIATWYGQQWFVKIRPALGIDKVDFEFVEIGKNGSGFHVWVDSDSFDIFCDLILSWKFYSMLQQDNGQYPSAFVYTTGENASCHLTIGKGKAGIIFFARITGSESKKASVPVMKSATLGDINSVRDDAAKFDRKFKSGYYELLTMAKLWKMVSGQTPVTGYYGDFVTKAIAASNRSAEFRQKQSENQQPSSSAAAQSSQSGNAGRQAPTAVPHNVAAQANQAPQAVSGNAPAAVSAAPSPAPAAPAQAKVNRFNYDAKVKEIRLQLTTELKAYNNDCYLARATTLSSGQKTDHIVYFPMKCNAFNEPGNFERLQDLAIRGDAKINIFCKEGFKYNAKATPGLLFCGFAN